VYEGEPANLVHGMNLLRFKVDRDRVDPHFLSFLLRWYRSRGVFIRLAGRAVGQSSVNQGRLRSLLVPMPSLPEQQAIARILRAAQQAREATEQVSAAVTELSSSLRTHLMRFGPVPLTEVPSARQSEDVDVGVFPEGWQVAPLSELAKVVTGKTPPTGDDGNFGGPYPFFTPGDVGGRRGLRHAERSLSEAGFRLARPVPLGTTLVVCIGTIGKVGITEVPVSTTNQQINAVVPGPALDPAFLTYALAHAKDRLVRAARQTTVRILSKGVFQALPFAFPPIDEQARMASLLESVDRKLEAERQGRDALDSLLASLVEELMSGVRRVGRLTGAS
jgi:type I restriction enzyme S subunit